MVTRNEAYQEKLWQEGAEAKSFRKQLKKTPNKDISFPCDVCRELVEIYLNGSGGLCTFCWEKDCCNESLERFLHDYAIKEGDVALIRVLQDSEKWIY
jgi:hypothetical protein